MTETLSLKWTGRVGLALLGAGTAAMLSFAGHAAADPSASGTGCNTLNTTVTGTGGNQSTNDTSNGGCVPNSSGPNGIGPGGPAYNGTDPRS
jgi:hypothetical protein